MLRIWLQSYRGGVQAEPGDEIAAQEELAADELLTEGNEGFQETDDTANMPSAAEDGIVIERIEDVTGTELAEEGSEETIPLNAGTEFDAAKAAEATVISAGSEAVAAEWEAGEAAYFKLTVAAGGYELYSEEYDGDGYCCMNLYMENEDGSVSLWASNYTDYETRNFHCESYLNAGTYYVLVSDINDGAGSCRLCTDRITAVSLEITDSVPDYTRLISGMDYYGGGNSMFRGMSFRVTYSNEETFNISSDYNSLNKYGQSVGYQLYRTEEDGSRTPVDLWDSMLSGEYVMVVSMGEASAETTVKFSTVAEAAKGNVLQSGGSLTIASGGDTVCASFVPTADGTYTFQGTDTERTWIFSGDAQSNLRQYVTGSSDTVKASLTAGETYYIACAPESGVTEQITISVEGYRSITAITMEDVSVGACELYDFFVKDKYPVTVSYGDGSQVTVSKWEDSWSEYRHFEGIASNGDVITLKFYDLEENQINFPPDSLGQYVIKAQIQNAEGETESASAQANLTVQEIPNGATSLNVGEASKAFTLDTDTVKYFAFEAPEDGSYNVSILDVNGAGCGWNEFLYRDGKALDPMYGIDRDDYGFYILQEGDIWIIKPVIYNGTAEGVTVTVKQKGKVTEISAMPKVEYSDDNEYSFNNVAYNLKSLWTGVQYSDGGSEYVYSWEEAYDEEGNRYYKSSVWHYNLQTNLIMTLTDQDENLVSIPKENLLDGDYTIHIAAEGTGIESEYNITVNVIPDNAVVMGIDAVSYQLDDTTQWFVFSTEQSGRYKLQYAEHTGWVDEIRIYQENENELQRIYSGDLGDDNGDGTIFGAEFEAQKRYYIKMCAWDTASGKLSFTEAKQITSVEFSEGFSVKDTYSVFTLGNELSQVACTVIYEDGTTETLKYFSEEYITAETGYWVLRANTQEGNEVVLRLTRDGMPVNVSTVSYGDRLLPIGNLKVELLADNVCMYEESIRSEMPSESEMKILEPGESQSVELAGGASVLYKTPVTEAEEGAYKLLQNIDEESVYLLQEEEDGLRTIGTVDQGELWYDLTAGTWYVYIVSDRYSGLQGTIELRKKSDIKNLTFTGSFGGTWIAGADDYWNIVGAEVIPPLKVEYEDDSSEQISVDTWRVNEDCYVTTSVYGAQSNGTEYNKYSLEAGEYVLVTEIYRNDSETWEQITLAQAELPFTVLSMNEAAGNHVFGESGSVTMESTNTYGAAFYTAESAGTVSFTADRSLSDFMVYTTGEEEFGTEKVYQSGASTYNVVLEAGESCILLMKSESGAGYTVTADSSVQIENVALSSSKTELIAGLDSISSSDLSVELTYSDGSKNRMAVSDRDAYGNKFRYQVADKSSGETVSKSQPLNIGTYLVQAIHRTFSSIMAETEVSAVAVDTSVLPVIEPEQNTDINVSGSRSLYTFTAAQDARYVLENSSGVSWGIYEPGEAGLVKAAGALKAGNTYVLCIDAMAYKRTMKLTAVLQSDTISSGTLVTADIQNGGMKLYNFTPEADGEYIVSVKYSGSDQDGLASVQVYDESFATVDGVLLSAEEKESRTVYSMAAGNTYQIQIENDSADGTYQIQITEKPDLTSWELTAKPADEVEGYYAEYAGLYRLNELFDITFHYSDGSSQSIGDTLEDSYGNGIRYVWNFISAALTPEGKAEVKFGIYMNDFHDEAQYVQYLEPVGSNIAELQADTVADMTLSQDGRSYFLFSPEESGNYSFSVSGIDSYELYDIWVYSDSWSEYMQENYRWMNAGKTYRMAIVSPKNAGATYQLTVQKKKEAVNLEIETKPSATVKYSDLKAMSELKAKLTYEDGTTAVLAYGETDEFGNTLECSVRALSNEKVRYYVSCADLQTYFDVENLSVSELPVLSPNVATEFACSYGMNEACASFTPDKSGIYIAAINTMENVYSGSPVFCDTETDNSYSNVLDLEAGRTYVMVWNYYSENTTAGTVSVTIAQADGELCAGGHTFGNWTTVKAATCTESGTESRICSVCGDTETREIPATGHSYGEWVVTKAATCTEVGTETRTCAACGDEQTREIPALGHEFGEWTIYMEATCTEAGQRIRTCTRCTQIETEVIPATGHQYGKEQIDEETNEKYQICDLCGDKKITGAVVDDKTKEQIEDAQNKLDEALKDENSTITDASLVEQVTAIDNQAVIDNGSMDLITGLEDKLLDSESEDSSITGTLAQSAVASGDGIVSDGVKVEGAAVTVAALLQNEASVITPDADTTYAAQLVIKENDTDKDTESGKLNYNLEITLNVVAKSAEVGETVAAEEVALAAPVRITIPVPEQYWNGEFTLYHTVNGQDVKVSYDRNDNQTITFCTPSLSPWKMQLDSCGENAHNMVVDNDQYVAPTCYLVGKTVSVCSNCGYKEETRISKTNHVLVEKSRSEATCTEAGQVISSCTNEGCTYSETEVLPATGHSWSEWVETEPTCTTSGVKVRTCETCGQTESQTTGSPLGHDWETTGTVTKQPTCTEAGVTTYHCSRRGCTATTQKAEPAATGHSYGAYVVTKQPTALAAGVKTRTCSKCGNKENASVAKLTPVLNLNAGSLKLKTKQSTKAFKVTEMAYGDYVASVKSSNTKILKVSKYTAQGAITLKGQSKTGTAKLTVTLASGTSKTIKVKVQKTAVKTTKVSISQRKLTLTKGQSASLAAVITPITSVEKVTYSTSKKAVATVSSKGVIKAKKKGTAVITVKSGKKKITCKVTVK